MNGSERFPAGSIFLWAFHKVDRQEEAEELSQPR